MTSELDIIDKHIEIEEKPKKRKSYALTDFNLDDKQNKRSRAGLSSSIAFPNEEYRLAVTKNYKKYGFTTMQSYIKALLDFAMDNDELMHKLVHKK